jgi:hypothetical protein
LSGFQEILYDAMPMHRENGFWVELDPFNGEYSVSYRHYLLIVLGLRCHFEAVWQGFAFSDERMVSCGFEWVL